MMETATYHERRGQLEEYFDRTASAAWAKLTSDAPVSRIRQTVRAGRDQMRGILLSYMPDDLRGQRVLDAGCGTGALSVEAARRGAEVVAIDLSANLIEIARERVPATYGDNRGTIDFRVSDMLDPSLGTFDWIVAMDSLIHYEAADMCEMIAALASRVRRGVAFTFAPKTPLLTAMHTVGKVFPRGDRAPAIEPIGQRYLESLLRAHPVTTAMTVGRTARVDSGFYISHAMEVLR
jgi:magnesium-protoporphyrin O-methyltransferase